MQAPTALRRPPALKRGDKVGLVAPARKLSRETIAAAIDQLRGWGLEVVEGENLYHEEHQFSGSDFQRSSDFQRMIDDPSVRAIICARGGYGSLRIVDRLVYEPLFNDPKWIVGYSDVTVFHSHLHAHMDMQTLHATMPVNFHLDPESTESLRRALFGETLEYVWTNELSAPNRAGRAEGVLAGGNLSLLYALNNSSSDIGTEGKILFIEDLDEQLYHIDRMMLCLKRAGKLENLAGLLVGGMTEMKDNAVPFGKTAEQIILGAVSEYSYPVAFGFPAGHTTKNMALRFGAVVQMDVSGESHAQITFH